MATKARSTTAGETAQFAVANPFGWPVLQRWQEEISGFMTRRLETDQSTFQEMCECRDAQTLLTLQQKWLTQAGEAYLEESRRLAALALEAVEAASAPERQA